MKRTFLFFTVILIPVVTLHAGARSSANYSVTTDTTESGGRRVASASYTVDASIGGIMGIATSVTPVQTVKSGYIGQLTEVTALQLAATPTTVNETATRQLSGAALLDDLTTYAIPAASITWSIVSGPLASISAGGLVTAGAVYQDTLATVQGIYAGNTGTLSLTVLNVSNDDIPGYTGDGLDDAWQVQYFGLGNPAAAPTFDADFDGQDNLFEFIAGINPTSGGSRFLIQNTPVPSQPGQMNIVISPRLPGRTYTVKVSPTLGTGAVWTTLTGSTTNDNGTERTITDPNATGPAKFYRVEIVKP